MTEWRANWRGLFDSAGDPLDCVRDAVLNSFERLEFGWTHAYAGLADWLGLYDEVDDDPQLRLVCLLEGIGHIADDVLRQPRFPYADGCEEWGSEAFLAAVEAENEARAIAQVRGALAGRVPLANIERACSCAALAHYNDFGHAPDLHWQGLSTH